jgi:haloalkane dehalogenase
LTNSSLQQRRALDYPGFGLSTPTPGYRYLPEEHADVVTGFVDALGLKGATLVGQDWGGLIGLAAVQRRPGVFDRLVLANTWAWPVNGVLHFEAFSRIIGGPPIRFLARRLNLLVNTFIPTGHRRRKPTAAEMTHYRRALGTPSGVRPALYSRAGSAPAGPSSPRSRPALRTLPTCRH